MYRKKEAYEVCTIIQRTDNTENCIISLKTVETHFVFHI